jgi:hypothetical protein
MKAVLFKTLSVGQVFTYDNKQYIRVADQKVSCCKILNAAETNNPDTKIMIKPLVTVQIEE